MVLDITRQVNEYAEMLSEFVIKHDLPAKWFTSPDHLAFKGADSSGFEELVEEFRKRATEISCIDMDNRRLATARLSGSIMVNDFGSVGWIEIMEPRPEKIGKDVVGLEHMEFFYPHFDEVTTELNERKIAYELQENPGHAWVNIVLNSRGQELKLNDKMLGITVSEEIKDGRSYII